jgi:cell division protein FtsL
MNGVIGRVVTWLLLLAVLVSAIAVVWSRNENRELFIRLTRLQSERDHLNIEYGRLELEDATWADPARVASVARNQLGMVNPEPAQIRMVRE